VRHNVLKWIGLLVLAAALLLPVGCVSYKTGPVRTEARSVQLEGAESAEVDLLMGAGELTLTGGAEALMDAEFTYNVAAWQPEVDYQITGDEGHLEVRQPEVDNIGALESYRYTWDVRLNDQVPMDLHVALGAGEGTLDVGGLALTRLDVDVGAGQGTIDLTGDRTSDLDVSVEAGVGDLTVRLPRDVGARVEVEGGLGEVDAGELRVEDGAYVNDAYGESGVTITVDIAGGVGQVSLELAD
jgi:hypothetical protein